MHVHLDAADDSFIKLTDNNNFKLMTLVTGAPSLIGEQFENAAELKRKEI